MKRTSYRLLAVALATAMLFCAAPFPAGFLLFFDRVTDALAADYLTSGFCGDVSDGQDGTAIAWLLDENGVLTLTGTGAMGSTPNRADNRVKKLVVGEGITDISDGAFSYCQNLEELTLPSTMETVGEKAFYYDEALRQASIGGARTVGAEAFRYCSALEQIDLGDRLSEIGKDAFDYCVSLQEIVFPDSMRTVGQSAFYGCTGLLRVDLGGGLREIGAWAFNRCSALTGALVFPDSCQMVKHDAFSNTGVTSIAIGAGLLSFAPARPMDSLTTITLSEENPNFALYEGVLYGRGYSSIVQIPCIQELRLPAAFPEKSDNILNGWSQLTSVVADPASEVYSSYDGVLYTKDGKRCLACPEGRTGIVTVRPGTEEIATAAFSSCKGITGAILPESLVKLGSSAFDRCDALETVNFPDSLKEIGISAFNTCKSLQSVSFGEGLETIGSYAFTNCTSLSCEVVFPDRCAAVGVQAFSYTPVTAFVVGASMTSFGTSDGMSSLQRIDVSPENGSYASYRGSLFTKNFDTLLQMPARSTLYLPAAFPLQRENNIPGFNSPAPSNFLRNIAELEAVEVEEGNAAYRSEDGILYSKDGTLCVCVPVKRHGSLTLPDGVRELAPYAMCNCRLLQSVTLPDGLKKIGYGAFNECNVLRTVTGAEALEEIADSAFQGCWYLSEFRMGPNVRRIGRYVFLNCGSLLTLRLSEKLREWDVTLCSLTSLRELIVPNRYTVFTGYGDLSPAEGGTVKGYCGSTAHELALKRGFAFESLGHAYLNWYTLTPAAFSEPGLERRDCAYCGGYEEREIPKLERDGYTATFMADGKIVAQIEFPENALSLEEPDVPAKDRYAGRWEDYTLTNEDLTVNAVYTLITGDAEEIACDSTAELYPLTDDVLFRMTARANAKTIVSTALQTVPLDIVLVADQSGSMAETLGGSVTKAEALKAAARGFLDTVQENAESTGAAHRVALVGFGLSGSYEGYEENENTELLTSARGVVPYDQITAADYASALIPVSDRTTLDAAVDALDARGATAADLGLAMAKEILLNNPAPDRDRVVVFMTDGAPTYVSSFNETVANSAVATAAQLKAADGCAALLYSVGIFNRTDAADRSVQAFMKAVSSDYPSASSVNNLGEQAAERFFITVDNTDALSGVFRTISVDSFSHTAPFENVTLIKTLSRYVTLTAPQEQALRIDVIRRYHIANDQIIVTRREDGTTMIRVEGLTPVENEEDGSYEVSLEFFASLNENASAAGEYAADGEDSGVMLGDAAAYEQTFPTSQVTLSEQKTRYLFTINGELYEIAEGSTVSAAVPQTDFSADWLFSGWNTTGIGSENGVIVDATLVKAPRTVTWHTQSGDTTQICVEGAFLEPPLVADLPDGRIFMSWDKSLPTVMPDRDLEFTAVYGGHVHRYVSEDTVRVTCTADGVRRFTCECGACYEVALPAVGHDFTTITPSTDRFSSRCSFMCANCGLRYQYALSYRIREKSENGGVLRYDFELTDDDLNVGFEPDGRVVISIPLSSFQNSAVGAKVTRTVNGRQEEVPYELKNGFLVIYADHFTPYDIELLFSCEDDAHVWGEAAVTRIADCKQPGEITCVCDVCGAVKTEATALDPDNHAAYGERLSCEREATCAAAGYTGDTVCAGCGAVLRQGNAIPPAPHTLTFIPEKAPTSQEPGNTAYYYCAVCGKSFADAQGLTETADVTLKPVAGEVCACGQTHTGPLAGLVRFFHKIVWFFKNLFRGQNA